MAFARFRRGVNLNSWLMQNGYLVLKAESRGGDYFEEMDWGKTRAYHSD